MLTKCDKKIFEWLKCNNVPMVRKFDFTDLDNPKILFYKYYVDSLTSFANSKLFR